MSPEADRNYEYDDTVHFMLRYSMDFRLKRVDRSIYGILDWLGDIGGFVEALSFIVATALFFFQF